MKSLKTFIFSALFICGLFLFANTTFAQVPSPSPIAGQAALDSVSHAVDSIPLAVPAWLLAVLAFVAEMALRFFPTVKPRSLFLFGAQLFSLLGAGFTKLSLLLDQIVQNLKK